jgi:G3E family GTPase
MPGKTLEVQPLLLSLITARLLQLRLDAIITLVDGHNVERHLDGNLDKGQEPMMEVYAQIAYADCVLLNKQVAPAVDVCVFP